MLVGRCMARFFLREVFTARRLLRKNRAMHRRWRSAPRGLERACLLRMITG